MKKPVTKRKWRINLVVSYNNQKIAEINRNNVSEFLKNLSSIYKLDYAISENHKFNYDKEFEIEHSKTECDIFYFRSNKNTRIKAKELRTTINSLFPYTYGAYYDGVEFFTQMTKALKEYPLPKEFYRPLKYPYVEFHNGSEMKLMLPYENVMEVIEKEQNFTMN
ncbi:MAG: hypothetical protein CVT95_10380 [Bacteroidetes bacterium HGW-Bacteroidetes-12]|nr:MAG: hypothetical protein CVT95_10380 [Bacteroidetes bacterium HGW-Bacteroidetes-12]